MLVAPSQNDSLSGWKADALSAFRNRMLDPDRPFPCIFGVEAVARGTLRYGFIDGPDRDAAPQLAELLTDFTQVCDELGKRTSFVCFFETWQPDTHESSFTRFWQLLAETSQLDKARWPDGFSAAPDDSSFEYSFNGQPMFVVVNTPLHERRQSRRFDHVAITFQPRFVFDDLAEGTTRGDEARKIVRSRLADYDHTPVTSLLGSFGNSDNREWNQYYLDDGEPVPALDKCPVHAFSTTTQ